jgi:hypothetical protein
MCREALVIAFHDERLYRFEQAGQHSASVFGGPMPSHVLGKSYGPKPLHRIACLGGWHLPMLNAHQLIELPLVYGMHYSGCAMSYRIEYAHKIELISIEPATSSDDFPYLNFPALLPFAPLRLTDTAPRASYEDFAARFPNMPEQQTAELMIAVPPPATLGVSLWAEGDGEGVTILFECDLKERKVTATNLMS